MPKGATSFASVRANPVTAARTLFERMGLSTGCFTAIDVTLMMRPHRRSFIFGSTARVSSTTLIRFWRTASCHTAAEWVSNGPAGGPPPFVTSTSTWPNSASVRAVRRERSSGFARSAATSTTRTPASVRIAVAVSRSVSAPRAQMTRSIPSRASSSATARPSPRLAAATRATFPPRPRSMLFRPVEVAVGAIQPILPGRAEDVDVERVLEGARLVQYVRGNVQHLSFTNDDFVFAVGADVEVQGAREDVRQLFVVVRVLRHERILLEIHMCEHHLVTGHELATDQV